MKLRQPFTYCETVPTPQDCILADEAQLDLICCFMFEAAFLFLKIYS